MSENPSHLSVTGGELEQSPYFVIDVSSGGEYPMPNSLSNIIRKLGLYEEDNENINFDDLLRITRKINELCCHSVRWVKEAILRDFVSHEEDLRKWYFSCRFSFSDGLFGEKRKMSVSFNIMNETNLFISRNECYSEC